MVDKVATLNIKWFKWRRSRIIFSLIRVTLSKYTEPMLCFSAQVLIYGTQQSFNFFPFAVVADEKLCNSTIMYCYFKAAGAGISTTLLGKLII